MKAYIQAYFDKLKTLVLDKSQITQLVPADCYRLALEIKSKTNKSISETTIKRVFGFASSVHQPSIYTLNALAEYCGYDGWDNFYTCIEQGKLQNSQQRTWSEVSLNATKISLFNIQSNKHKCGIPYHLTIDREHIHTFMESFHSSGATTGILSGPAGYGKTVAVSKWVEQQIGQNHLASAHDIYLFTNSLSLLQGTAFSYHCNRWLAHLLGFDTSDLLDSFMESYGEAAPGNFYLVIDELHCDLVADRQFHNIISQFIEMVRHFAQYRWFRVILVLRTATLFKYESLFKDTIINPQWFSVLNGTPKSKSAEMTAFSTEEVRQLVQNIGGKTDMHDLLKSPYGNLTNIPLFFQYYHELVGDKLNPGRMTLFDEYLIISQYLRKKVFNGINTLAKQGLLEELSMMTEEYDNTLQIGKKQAYAVIKQYRTAYNDLLYSGTLHEINYGLEVRQQTIIRFQSDHIATYFMALQLFNKYEDVEQLLYTLNHSTTSNKLKSGQLKWLLLFAIEAGDLRMVNRFESISFLNEDRFETAAFICDGLYKLGSAVKQSIRSQTDLSLYDSPFVEYALNHTCFQTEYEPNIAKLLNFNLSDTHEIILRSKLAFIALLKWEEGAFLAQIEQLSRKRPEGYACFVANPLLVLSYLYQYFKNGCIDEEATHELDTLYQRMSLSDTLITNQLFDLLIYALIKVSGETGIAHRYQEIVRRRLDQLSLQRTAEREFTKLIYALYLVECGEAEKAYASVSPQSLSHQDNPSYRLLYTIFLIQSGRLTGQDEYRKLGQQAIAICETYGFKLLEAYCRILILEEVPEADQSLHVNNLKFQFAAFGYTVGLRSLSKKYG